ncbi:MAG: PmoA family protein [Candidatus Hydrogenedentales bacterium]
MNVRSMWVLAIAATAAMPCMAAEKLDGRTIKLEAGTQTSMDVPVSLPFDGALPDGSVIRVREDKTGKEFPATLRDGQLTFVPEGALPSSTHYYTVMVRKDNVPPRVRIEAGDKLDVFIDDELFTSYYHTDKYKKPFLWPLLSEGGVGVTRDWPMGEKEVTEDHVHQKSFWTAYGNVNGVNCWEEGDKENLGTQVSVEVTHGSGDGYGWIHAKNVWVDQSKKPVVAEEREYRFYPAPARSRIFDVAVTFTATEGDVLFKDTKEGGIVALRIRDIINEQNGGTITLAGGLSGESVCWGKPAAWCDYSGPIEGAGVRGVTVFDNPENLRYPTRWHVRAYGLLGANCFGLSYFTEKEETRLNGDYTIKKGETATFKYRILVHSGNAADAKIDDRYADYATPPKVSWAAAKPN